MYDFVFGSITMGKQKLSEKLSLKSKISLSTFHTVATKTIQQVKNNLPDTPILSIKLRRTTNRGLNIDEFTHNV
jgi:hypothetical protein